MIAAAPVWAMVAYFGTYGQAQTAFYSAAFTAALVLLLPGYRARGWFWLALGAISLVHGVWTVFFADRFGIVRPEAVFLVFVIDFLACLGIFMAIARLRRDTVDPLAATSAKPTPSPDPEEGAD